MKNNLSLLTLLAVVSGIGALLANSLSPSLYSIVNAQVESSFEYQVAQETSGLPIEEVVVTGQRRGESLQDTSIPITAVHLEKFDGIKRDIPDPDDNTTGITRIYTTSNVIIPENSILNLNLEYNKEILYINMSSGDSRIDVTHLEENPYASIQFNQDFAWTDRRPMLMEVGFLDGTTTYMEFSAEVGALNTITLDEGGAGYASLPTITIGENFTSSERDAALEDLTTYYLEQDITVTAEGTGYTAVPWIVIDDPGIDYTQGLPSDLFANGLRDAIAGIEYNTADDETDIPGANFDSPDDESDFGDGEAGTELEWIPTIVMDTEATATITMTADQFQNIGEEPSADISESQTGYTITLDHLVHINDVEEFMKAFVSSEPATVGVVVDIDSSNESNIYSTDLINALKASIDSTDLSMVIPTVVKASEESTPEDEELETWAGITLADWDKNEYSINVEVIRASGIQESSEPAPVGSPGNNLFVNSELQEVGVRGTVTTKEGTFVNGTKQVSFTDGLAALGYALSGQTDQTTCPVSQSNSVPEEINVACMESCMQADKLCTQCESGEYSTIPNDSCTSVTDDALLEYCTEACRFRSVLEDIEGVIVLC